MQDLYHQPYVTLFWHLGDRVLQGSNKGYKDRGCMRVACFNFPVIVPRFQVLRNSQMSCCRRANSTHTMCQQYTYKHRDRPHTHGERQNTSMQNTHTHKSTCMYTHTDMQGCMSSCTCPDKLCVHVVTANSICECRQTLKVLFA